MPAHGLTTRAAEAYHVAHGYNEIAEHKKSLIGKIVARTVSPISGMLIVASALSFFGGKAFDGSFILVLLVINIAVSVWQEFKADSAIAELNKHLGTFVKVLRDGRFTELPSRELAPGDVVELSSGAVIPADASVVKGNALTVNEAALTGESLPKEKKTGEALYSGSFVASGLGTVEITAVGSLTFFGKTLAKADMRPKKSALEKDILRISQFLSFLSIIAVGILTVSLVLGHAPWLEVLRLDLSLVIAGIPISLPTVMTLIIALGIVALAKKNVVVRRLSALEELANTDFLLTDKTGTLTENRIVVDRVSVYGETDEKTVRRLAALVASEEPDSVLNRALLSHTLPPKTRLISYAPGDSVRKRATLTYEAGGEVRTLSLGAPQIIAGLCALAGGMRAQFERDVSAFAEGGYRALALAEADGTEEKNMRLAGLFALSDELREDAPETIRFLNENGIGVVMVTGDNRAIAKEIAKKLSISGGRVVTHEELEQLGWDNVSKETFSGVQAFAEILPEDKLRLVEKAKNYYTVASNGDGVNDLPAVKAASVGFAVKNAVDALKSAADIVLLSDGIGVMKDAFIEGRKIFERLYAYSLYRVSESFRLIVTIVILGLWAGAYPLSPLQLIILALLNDIPIISLATDSVRIANKPSKINVRRQFMQSILYGTVGVFNSVLLYFFAVYLLHLPLPIVETLFFLKLTVSGHLLIYVAHTKERWWKHLPSTPVIAATTVTQLLATGLAVTGFLMPAPISWVAVIFIWAWAFFFMQVSELVKRSREGAQTA